MWGRHVESVMRDAAKGAKTDKDAERKVMSAITRVLSDPISKEDSENPNYSAPVSRKFRDPAEMMRSK